MCQCGRYHWARGSSHKVSYLTVFESPEDIWRLTSTSLSLFRWKHWAHEFECFTHVRQPTAHPVWKPSRHPPWWWRHTAASALYLFTSVTQIWSYHCLQNELPRTAQPRPSRAHWSAKPRCSSAWGAFPLTVPLPGTPAYLGPNSSPGWKAPTIAQLRFSFHAMLSPQENYYYPELSFLLSNPPRVTSNFP